MSALTLPGTIPGLLRRGSPVCADIYGQLQCGVLMLRADDSAIVAWESADLTAHPTYAKLLLDLTDATGRAHAAWWLAARAGIARVFQDTWMPLCLAPPWFDARELRDENGDYASGDGWACAGDLWPARAGILADLDPNDPRLLPDGSRWVDAEALRRVCLHVAGLS